MAFQFTFKPTFLSIALCLVILILSTLKAHAYSLSNHQTITEDAVALINECRSQQFITTLDPSAQLGVLVKYNVHQDQLLRKARLWHFPYYAQYPPQKEATGWIGNTLVISTSFNVWTDYLYQQALKANRHQTVYPAIGALLHYVQDVAVPAHAVPIFHPVRYLPPKADGFDSWDEFNEYPWLKNRQAQQHACAELASINLTAQDIINNTLQQTKNNIQEGLSGQTPEHIPEQIRAANIWMKLYPVNGPKEYGFGQYGCDSEGDYGVESLTCHTKPNVRESAQESAEGSAQEFEVSHHDYIKFASKQRNLAVLASAQLIYNLQKTLLLTPCNEPEQGCVAKYGDDRWLPNKRLLNRLIN